MLPTLKHERHKDYTILARWQLLKAKLASDFRIKIYFKTSETKANIDSDKICVKIFPNL